MANHKSSIKRIRQSAVARLRNRYHAKTTRTMIKRLRALTTRAEAQAMYPQVVSQIDRLAKRNIIHKNKAANQKSKLARRIAKLA